MHHEHGFPMDVWCKLQTARFHLSSSSLGSNWVWAVEARASQIPLKRKIRNRIIHKSIFLFLKIYFLYKSLLNAHAALQIQESTRHDKTHWFPADGLEHALFSELLQVPWCRSADLSATVSPPPCCPNWHSQPAGRSRPCCLLLQSACWRLNL